MCWCFVTANFGTGCAKAFYCRHLSCISVQNAAESAVVTHNDKFGNAKPVPHDKSSIRLAIMNIKDHASINLAVKEVFALLLSVLAFAFCIFTAEATGVIDLEPLALSNELKNS